jgi:hypothetical protein
VDRTAYLDTCVGSNIAAPAGQMLPRGTGTPRGRKFFTPSDPIGNVSVGMAFIPNRLNKHEHMTHRLREIIIHTQEQVRSMGRRLVYFRVDEAQDFREPLL